MDWPISDPTQKHKSGWLTIDGDPVVEEPCMFEIGMYFYVFYCLCYIKDIPLGMLD